MTRSTAGPRFFAIAQNDITASECRGRTRQNKVAVFDGPRELIGKLVSVQATAGRVWGFDRELT